jgi:hypothetical protein
MMMVVVVRIISPIWIVMMMMMIPWVMPSPTAIPTQSIVPMPRIIIPRIIIPRIIKIDPRRGYICIISAHIQIPI